MSATASILGQLEPKAFLEQYWQKRPLLVRNAFPGFTSPLDGDDLAGLGCEDEVSSRLILERGGRHPWEVRYGPFSPEVFAALPESHWTLLVQQVELHCPQALEVLDAFSFIPAWRIDDLMVSFAAREGSVGPHLDSYDAFLIQAAGRRRWQVGAQALQPPAYLPDLELAILAEFEPREEWVLQPGDLLYVPPGLPHHGVALDDGQTWSVGFRAPSHRDLLIGFAEHCAERVDADARYADPDLLPPRNTGEINPLAIERARRLVNELLRDGDDGDWFGTLVTQGDRDPDPPPEQFDKQTLLNAVRAGGTLARDPAQRFAHLDHGTCGVTLFVSGEAWKLPAALRDAVVTVTGERYLNYNSIGPWTNDDTFLALLLELCSRGFLSLTD